MAVPYPLAGGWGGPTDSLDGNAFGCALCPLPLLFWRSPDTLPPIPKWYQWAWMASYSCHMHWMDPIQFVIFHSFKNLHLVLHFLFVFFLQLPEFLFLFFVSQIPWTLQAGTGQVPNGGSDSIFCHARSLHTLEWIIKCPVANFCPLWVGSLACVPTTLHNCQFNIGNLDQKELMSYIWSQLIIIKVLHVLWLSFHF